MREVERTLVRDSLLITKWRHTHRALAHIGVFVQTMAIHILKLGDHRLEVSIRRIRQVNKLSLVIIAGSPTCLANSFCPKLLCSVLVSVCHFSYIYKGILAL